MNMFLYAERRTRYRVGWEELEATENLGGLTRLNCAFYGRTSMSLAHTNRAVIGFGSLVTNAADHAHAYICKKADILNLGRL